MVDQTLFEFPSNLVKVDVDVASVVGDAKQNDVTVVVKLARFQNALHEIEALFAPSLIEFKNSEIKSHF